MGHHEFSQYVKKRAWQANSIQRSILGQRFVAHFRLGSRLAWMRSLQLSSRLLYSAGADNEFIIWVVEIDLFSADLARCQAMQICDARLNIAVGLN